VGTHVEQVGDGFLGGLAALQLPYQHFAYPERCAPQAFEIIDDRGPRSASDEDSGLFDDKSGCKNDIRGHPKVRAQQVFERLCVSADGRIHEFAVFFNRVPMPG